ncbi:MAG TPA: hypothetical protein VMU05_05755 [Dongiaceae bacterium]|nr:hypothetical protein [Dongiaceae bacterium]
MGGGFGRAGRFAQYEAVAATDYGLQKLWLRRIVVKSFPDLPNCRVYSLLDINENICAPQAVRDLVTRNQMPLILDKKHKELQRKSLQPDRFTFAKKLKTAEIELEFTEANIFAWHEQNLSGAVRQFWSGSRIVSRSHSSSD